MKRTAFCLLLLIVGTVVWKLAGQEAANRPLYLDPSARLEDRVSDLVGRMTLEEKVSQMQHTAPAIDRLGIPEYNWWNEALHGVARNGVATVFPQAIGMAATWNPDLIYREAEVISTEGRAKYYDAIGKGEHKIYQGLTFWSPNINIFRDPRWGRGQETYGEDPFLTASIGTAFVKGLQGDNDRYFKVIATAKHFAVHSGPEQSRHSFDAWPSERDLYETYLPAFESLVKDAGVYSFMGAYNRLYAVPACASYLLMQNILRERWGFDGYVVSDCWAVSDFTGGHRFVSDPAKAAALAVKAGTDLSCGPEYSHLVEAVQRGYLSQEDIDRSVRRLFTARFKLGMFDPRESVPYGSITPADNNKEAHRQLAAEVAAQSLVLLKNENHALPLNKSVKKLAVIGPYADELSVLLGNYNGDPSKPVKILEGIRNRAPKGVKVGYAVGVDPLETIVRDTARIRIQERLAAEAYELAAASDAVIFVGGISPELEGEEMPVKIEGFSGGDRTSLDLPRNQLNMIEQLSALKKPVILVLTGGSALAVSRAQEILPAILLCWYPGEEGGNAVADVLFGNRNPAGRLPVTFYKSVEDIPEFEDYSMEGRTYRYFRGEPLYPFGFGLSFTSFGYSGISPESQSVKPDGQVEVSLRVSNVGDRDGDEVVQLYLRQPESVKGRPVKTLVGFRRITIRKGNAETVRFTLTPNQLRHYDPVAGDYKVAEGTYQLEAGASSTDIRAKAEFTVRR